MFEQFFEAGLGDAVIFLAAPQPQQERDWRVGELHVVRSDGGCDDGIDEGERVECGQQADYQLRNDVLVVVLSNDDDLVLADREVKQQNQRLEALLLLHLAFLQQRPSQRRPL